MAPRVRHGPPELREPDDIDEALASLSGARTGFNPVRDEPIVDPAPQQKSTCG
jgi:hypothetical protein